ncbi:MAG TPA: hydrogenase maturation nickel metallochaperone HypA [bacterium]|nr:hydrogenase maturation nickel metallochaperone HypA [bacterium]
MIVHPQRNKPMHESSLMRDLLAKIEAALVEQGACRVVRVSIRLGALCGISPGHFRGHFSLAAQGTPAEHAFLEIKQSENLADPHARDVLLERLEVEYE